MLDVLILVEIKCIELSSDVIAGIFFAARTYGFRFSVTDAEHRCVVRCDDVVVAIQLLYILSSIMVFLPLINKRRGIRFLLLKDSTTIKLYEHFSF